MLGEHCGTELYPSPLSFLFPVSLINVIWFSAEPVLFWYPLSLPVSFKRICGNHWNWLVFLSFSPPLWGINPIALKQSYLGQNTQITADVSVEGALHLNAEQHRQRSGFLRQAGINKGQGD